MRSNVLGVADNLEIPCQHGFVKRRSTTTNLLELTSFVIDELN